MGARKLNTPPWSPLFQGGTRGGSLAPVSGVYKPGTWVTTFGDMGDTSIRTWKPSLEDHHALERGVGHVVALGVCGIGESVECEFYSAVPPLWHQSGQGVQVVETVSSGRTEGAGESQPSTSPVARTDKQNDGRADCQSAGSPSRLGSLEDPSPPEGLGSGGGSGSRVRCTRFCGVRDVLTRRPRPSIELGSGLSRRPPISCGRWTSKVILGWAMESGAIP